MAYPRQVGQVGGSGLRRPVAAPGDRCVRQLLQQVLHGLWRRLPVTVDAHAEHRKPDLTQARLQLRQACHGVPSGPRLASPVGDQPSRLPGAEAGRGQVPEQAAHRHHQLRADQHPRPAQQPVARKVRRGGGDQDQASDGGRLQCQVQRRKLTAETVAEQEDRSGGQAFADGGERLRPVVPGPHPQGRPHDKERVGGARLVPPDQQPADGAAVVQRDVELLLCGLRLLAHPSPSPRSSHSANVPRYR